MYVGEGVTNFSHAPLSSRHIMVSNSTEYMRTYMRSYWKNNPDKVAANRRTKLIQKHNKGGTVPRDSTIKKHNIKPSELTGSRRPTKTKVTPKIAVLKRISKTGRKPRDTTMIKYKITDDDLIKTIGNSWCRSSYIKPVVNPEVVRLRAQLRELKNLM